MRYRLLVPGLLLALLLPCAATAGAAQDERELEGWQRRVLRALEREADRQEDAQRRNLRAPGTRDPGAAKAAATAVARYGGRPLAVVPAGDGYKVRLLLDSGRVVTVTIRD